jgi:hypothetical protein
MTDDLDNSQEDFYEDDPAIGDTSEGDTPENEDLDRPMTVREQRELIELMKSQQPQGLDVRAEIQEAVQAALGVQQPRKVARETFEDPDNVNVGLQNRQFMIVAEQMIEEAITDPQTPKEVISGLKEAIYGVGSLEELKDLRKKERHIDYVGSRLMKLTGEGKYTPPQFRAKQQAPGAANGRGAASPQGQRSRGNQPDWMPKDRPGFNYEGQNAQEYSIVKEYLSERGIEDLSPEAKNYLKTGGVVLRR